MLQEHIFLIKVLRAAEWADFQANGHFAGSPDDRRDGFIHLSTADQLAGTLARHFVGGTELVAVTRALHGDPMLRWEESRGGQPFPHLYRPLLLADVIDADQLQ